MNQQVRIFLCFYFIAVSISVSAQAQTDTTIFSIAEQMPEYPGGIDSLLKEISSKVVYPKVCADSNIQGKVYLRFVVNEDGRVSNIEVIKSPHKLLGEAAIAATQGIGKFKPGLQAGKNARVWYSLPINFRIKPVASANKGDTIYQTVDIPAEYLGGEEKMKADLVKNMIYPPLEFKENVQGQVVVRVIINTQGVIESAVILKSISAGLDQEALRVVKLLHIFKPSYYQGRPVNSYLTIPIDFNLHFEEHTLYLGGMNSISFTSVFANTGGAGDNRGKFLFYYYKDGYDAFSKFISENMNYPLNALKNKTEAILKVNCRVNKELKLEPVLCLNDPENIFSEEAFRLIELCPPFNEEIIGSTFLNDTLPVNIVFVLDKRHQWGQSAQKDEAQAKMLTEDGVKLFEKGKYEKAFDYFTAAIRYYSLYSKAFFNRAATELKMNKPEDACDDFRRAYMLGDLDALNAIKQACN